MWQKLETSFALANAKFKLKNEGSYLGLIWYLLNPIIIFLFLIAIFTNNLGSKIPNYAAYLFLGIILFNLFQFVTSSSMKVIWGNISLIKSMKIRISTLVQSEIILATYSHLFDLVLLIIILFFTDSLNWSFLFYPFVLILFLIFLYGLSLGIAVITIYFADLENIWAFLVRILFFATPIFYQTNPLSVINYVNLINPLFFFVTFARDIILLGKLPEMFIILGTFGYTFLSLILGLFILNKLKRKVPEKI